MVAAVSLGEEGAGGLLHLAKRSAKVPREGLGERGGRHLWSVLAEREEGGEA